MELVGAGVTYPGTVPVHALAATDLVIGPGEMLAVMGRSGSGKSTLLNVLGLLERPTRGTYRVRGVDTTGLTESGLTALRGAQFGFVFQAHHLLADRTALENTQLPQMYRRVPAKRRQAAAREALARVGLADRVDALPGTLSGGERQRANIARALAQSPRVLLCDEPTGALDRGNAERIVDLLFDLNACGLTIVVVTHDHEVAARLPRLVYLDDGRLTSPAGTPADAGLLAPGVEAVQR